MVAENATQRRSFTREELKNIRSEKSSKQADQAAGNKDKPAPADPPAAPTPGLLAVPSECHFLGLFVPIAGSGKMTTEEILSYNALNQQALEAAKLLSDSLTKLALHHATVQRRLTSMSSEPFLRSVHPGV